MGTNASMVTEFVLVSFSRLVHIQVLLFSLFLAVYLLTVAGNLLIVALLSTDCNPPCISSSTSSQHWRSAPHRSPSPCCYTICSLAGATSRAPAALCRCSFSSALAPTSAACWACGALVGLGHTSFIFSLPCCGPNAIPHFFCEIQPVLQLVCIDTSVNEQQNILAAVLIILCPFGLILSSYGRILVTIFSIPSAAGRGLHLFFPPRSGISLLRYCHLYLYLP